MGRLLLIILLAVLACPTSLGAQPLSEARRVRMIDTGSEVRIGVTLVERRHPYAIVDRRIQSLVDRHRVRGIVRRITPDSLYLGISGSDSVVAFPRSRIQGVDLNLGRSRRASAYELALNLALLGGLVMSSKFEDEDKTPYRTDWHAGAVGAAVGFGGGAVFGFLFPYERWRTGWIPE